MQREIVRAISREEMASLPIRRYEGEICLVSTTQHLERAIADLGREEVVGFDTETRPAFKKGEAHLPCLAQVATARRVYLFQLAEPRLFPVLADLLAETRLIKAGVALAHDLRSLKLLFPFDEQSVIDLGVLARRIRLDQTGVRNLAGILLGARIPKGARTSNWAAPRLTAAQIKYAATDAWICRELFLELQRRGLLPAKPSASALPSVAT
jgi:ribonuclease D